MMKELSLVLLTAMLLLLMPIHLVKADNWVEVIRFEGTSGISEEHFTCDNVEWRIRWDFDPGHFHFFPEDHSLAVATYREGEDMYLVDSIYEMGNESTTGTSYVHDDYGKYFMAIRALGTENYTITIEQNIDSIPEFPSGCSAVTSGDNRVNRGYQKASKLEASPEKRQPSRLSGRRLP